MPATFLDLPTELHLLIKNWIPPWDLRTHACFYLSDPQCASLYDSRPNPDRFWKLLCWRNGLGQLPDETTEAETTWRDIATRTIHADGFCTHPQCGEALLEYNRASMQEAAKHVQPFSPLRFHDGYDGEARTAIHPVITHIGFRPSSDVRHWSSKSPHIARDAHLRQPGDHNVLAYEALKNREYLWRHPLAARSFATFVPTVSVFLFGIAGIELKHDQISSARALTVLEVLELIQRALNHDLTVRQVSGCVLGHEGCLALHGWSTYEIFVRVRSLREILTICPVQDLVFDEYTDCGPAFSVELH